MMDGSVLVVSVTAVLILALSVWVFTLGCHLNTRGVRLTGWLVPTTIGASGIVLALLMLGQVVLA